MWRCWLTNARDPWLTKIRLLQAVVSNDAEHSITSQYTIYICSQNYAYIQVMSVIYGLVYLRQDYNQEGVTNINALLVLLQLYMTMGSLNSVIQVSRCN